MKKAVRPSGQTAGDSGAVPMQRLGIYRPSRVLKS